MKTPRQSKPAAADATSDETAEFNRLSGLAWDVVGWAFITLPSCPSKVADLLTHLAPDDIRDPSASACLRGLKEVLALDSPTVAEAIAAAKRAAGSDLFDAGRLAEALEAADKSTPAAERAVEALLASRVPTLLSDALWRYQRSVAEGSRSDLAQLRSDIDHIFSRRAIAATVEETPFDLLSIAQRCDVAERERLIRTGFAPFDDRFGGGLPLGITAIAAKPKRGKSALAMQVTLGALLHNPRLSAVWFRGEMTEQLLFSRMVAVWSFLREDVLPPVSRRQFATKDREASKVAADMVRHIGDRLHIIPPGKEGMTDGTIVSGVEKHRPGLVVVDYLQRCHTPGVTDRRASIDFVLGRVADVTNSLELATIVVSSVAKQAGPSTDIGGITKESNQLDYDAHNLVTLWRRTDRDEGQRGGRKAVDDNQKAPDPCLMRMIVHAARTGGEGEQCLEFSGSRQSFRPIDRQGYAHQGEPFAEFAGMEPEGSF